MKMSDFEIDQPVTILIIAGEQKMEFPSSIILTNPKKHTAYLSPIMKDGKILNFNGKGIVTHILVQLPDSKPLVFREVTLNTMKKDDGTFCYGMHSNEDGVEVNRRGAFRCSVGISTMLRVGFNRTSYDIILRDISLTGFAFVFDNNNNNSMCDIGQMVHTVLNDYIAEVNENFQFQIYGTVVRKEELENGKIVFGCKLSDNVRGLDNYIAVKERIRSRSQRGR